MRWATKSTWIRIAVLFGIYLLVLAAWFILSRVSDSMEIVKSLVFLILLAILPILAMAFGAWDGVKEGFSLLWLFAPLVFFHLLDTRSVVLRATDRHRYRMPRAGKVQRA